jgi:hypothetical protein
MKQFLQREGFSHVDGDKSSRRGASYLRAVVIGTHGPWTAVKLSDAEFMCKRRDGQDRPRISELAIFLGRAAFQVSVYDGDSMTLLEASKGGRFCVSGGEAATASRRFHEERIARKRHFDPGFHLLRVSDELDNVGGDWMDIASLLVPGIDPDLIATDGLFATKAKAPSLPHAQWMAFDRGEG